MNDDPIKPSPGGVPLAHPDQGKPLHKMLMRGLRQIHSPRKMKSPIKHPKKKPTFY